MFRFLTMLIAGNGAQGAVGSWKQTLSSRLAYAFYGFKANEILEKNNPFPDLEVGS
jgi:hypothetical protein